MQFHPLIWVGRPIWLLSRWDNLRAGGVGVSFSLGYEIAENDPPVQKRLVVSGGIAECEIVEHAVHAS